MVPAVNQEIAFSIVKRTSTTGVPMQILSDLEGCYGTAINDGGVVAGACGNYPTSPFAWFPDLGRIDLDFRGAAQDINNSGDVVGYRHVDSGGFRPFLWRRGARRLDLPTPGVAHAISDRGVVVGGTEDGFGNPSPYKWSREGGFVLLEADTALPRYFYDPLVAVDITNGGRIAGLAGFPWGERPVFWLPFDGFIDTSGPYGPWYDYMIVEAINERNEILALVADPATDSSYVYVLSPKRGIISVAPGSHRRWPAGIDDQGVVAGTYQTEGGMPGGPTHAFVWNQGQTIDLGTLGGENSWADAINERGTVLGRAQDERNNWHMVIWRTR
jgi:probable HAF family extracellular repeat protein